MNSLQPYFDPSGDIRKTRQRLSTVIPQKGGTLADRYDEIERTIYAPFNSSVDYYAIDNTADSIKRLGTAKALNAVDQNLAGNPDIMQLIKRHMKETPGAWERQQRA